MLLLSMYGRVFPDGAGLQVSRLSEHSPQHGWAPSTCLGAQIGQKNVENDNFPLTL